MLAPLALVFIGARGIGFWWDLAMALGYAGVAMMGVQFVLTARFKRACAPYGIDLIYYLHRYLALVALGLILGHAVIAGLDNPAALAGFDLRRLPGYLWLGLAALGVLIALIVVSLWRKRLRIDYDHWRFWHGLVAVTALLLAVAHVHGAVGHFSGSGLRIAWTALALVWLLPLLHVRVLRPLRLQRRPYRVLRVEREHGRTHSLYLAPDGHAGFDYQPGQFAWLSLRASPFALREHPFSFASSPTRPGELSFAIKALGDFTATLGEIQPGEIAYVDGPYGAFSCDRHRQAAGYGFIAGGVGIAPIMSMLRTLADRGEVRPLALIYCNRVWEHVVFREELQALAGRLDLRLVHVLGEPPPTWDGERGLLTQAILERHLPPHRGDWHYFVCGPTPMLRIAERGLGALGVPLRRVHSELFDLA